jgi:hypothetical protein
LRAGGTPAIRFGMVETIRRDLVIRSRGLRGGVLLRCLARETELAHWNPGPDNEIKKLITQKVEN